MSCDVNIAQFSHYSDVLQAELSHKQQGNKRFSLRAFAKQLDLSPATLSGVLNKKNNLSREMAQKIAEKLRYNADRHTYFLDLYDYIHSDDIACRDRAYSRIQEFRNRHHARIIEDDEFQMISNWYNLAILELIKINGFQLDQKWIAQRLGISELETIAALNRLKRLGFIKVCDKQVELLVNATQITPRQSSRSLAKAQMQMLSRAQEYLMKAPESETGYMGMTVVALNKQDLPGLKDKLKAFRSDTCRELAKAGQKDEVYCIATLAFDVTQKENSQDA